MTLPGVFHTVNPAANDVYPIYKENAREYCLLKTERFGTILMMEVGAMMVGKISNLQKKTATVKKGQEKGNFEFGGSTVILLLQPGKVRIDYDLLDNTEEGYETIVKMGERIGECKKVKKLFLHSFPHLPPFTFAALGFCGGASASRKRVRSACMEKKCYGS